MIFFKWKIQKPAFNENGFFKMMLNHLNYWQSQTPSFASHGQGAFSAAALLQPHPSAKAAPETNKQRATIIQQRTDVLLKQVQQ